MSVTINVYGIEPEDIRCEEINHGDTVEYNDDATKIANEIERLLRENYEYLDVGAVAVDVEDVKAKHAADFPE